MMTILKHISLIQLRACKNRTSLHFALQRARTHTIDPTLIQLVEATYAANVTLITQLDTILNRLGRKPGPTQP